jgi:hypothetical protein
MDVDALIGIAAALVTPAVPFGERDAVAEAPENRPTGYRSARVSLNHVKTSARRRRLLHHDLASGNSLCSQILNQCRV